jgi:hypothetical protein
MGDFKNHLDYTSEDTDLDISNVLVRDWLPAKAFPSRTGPMGSAANKLPLWLNHNYDMFSSDFITDLQKWPIEDIDDNKLWRHSDWKNVPYVHVYQLFEKIVTKGQ